MRQTAATSSRTRKRIGVLSVMGMLGVLIATLFVAAPANALPHNSIIWNRQTGRCLDSNLAGSVYTLPCNGGNFQNWYVVYVGEWGGVADYTIRNSETGRCLDANTAGSVYTLPCSYNNWYQHWSFTGSESSAKIRHHHFGRVLDSNWAGHVYTLGSNGGNFQNWRIDGF